MTLNAESSMTNTKKKTAGVVVKEHRPFGPTDERSVHGVTFDGKHVWFARDNELIAFDPEKQEVVKQFSIPGAGAGTAFDGKHIYQLAKTEILVVDPSDGSVVRRLPSPGKGADSGMAYADGYLWVGQYRSAQIMKIDAKTGEVVKTLRSDRYVTGVSCIDGQLWHGAAEDGKPSELRRLAPDGEVEETIEVPVKALSGMERAGDTFWCGGEKGTLRLVKRAP